MLDEQGRVFAVCIGARGGACCPWLYAIQSCGAPLTQGVLDTLLALPPEEDEPVVEEVHDEPLLPPH